MRSWEQYDRDWEASEMVMVTFCKRTEDPKLAYLERRLDALRIPHQRNGFSFHAPVLEVPERLIIIQDLHGSFLYRYEQGSDVRIPEPLGLKDARLHIGLSTNVRTLSRKQWEKRIAEGVIREAASRAREKLREEVKEEV